MLTKTIIIRAWKDKAFRASLSEEELQNLPSHPSGLIELSDDNLGTVAGGTMITWGVSSICFWDCGSATYHGTHCALWVFLHIPPKRYIP